MDPVDANFLQHLRQYNLSELIEQKTHLHLRRNTWVGLNGDKKRSDVKMSAIVPPLALTERTSVTRNESFPPCKTYVHGK
ncbi:hypothetical protein J6590_016698 [Homalodisca vitripennis]|nr:hypothetical protein J6590_016698 [Homalodisca vitripennis]